MRVLLVDGEPDRAAAVREWLEAAECAVAAIAPRADDLVRLVREAAAEAVVCVLDDPGADALESLRALHREAPRPVVVFAARGAPAQIEAAIEAGVAAYVVQGLSPGRLRPVIEVAVRRFRAQEALRARLEETRATLADRVLIERAKGMLMQRRRLTEEEAHRQLRRLAMDRGEKLVQAARRILEKA